MPTDRTGAPANGVRFLLYAVDPVTFQPVEPLVEAGYVDITDLSGGNTQSVGWRSSPETSLTLNTP